MERAYSHHILQTKFGKLNKHTETAKHPRLLLLYREKFSLLQFIVSVCLFVCFFFSMCVRLSHSFCFLSIPNPIIHTFELLIKFQYQNVCSFFLFGNCKKSDDFFGQFFEYSPTIFHMFAMQLNLPKWTCFFFVQIFKNYIQSFIRCMSLML